MKTINTLKLSTIAICLSTTLEAASTVGWNAISDGNIVNSDYIHNNGDGLIGHAVSDPFDNGGVEHADVKADSIGSSGDLKAYALVQADTGIYSDVRRVNGYASAGTSRTWRLSSSTIASGGAVSSFVDLSWDGHLAIYATPANFGSPYFNDVSFEVNFTIYQIDPMFEEGEPIPILSYGSGEFGLRADGTNLFGHDLATNIANFNKTVDEYDVGNPMNPTGNTYDLNVSILNANPTNGYQYDVDINGELPFNGIVGKLYRVDYDLSVNTNITGAFGFAEADFFNTGSANLRPNDPLEGSYSVIPEPSPLLMFAVSIPALFGMRRRKLG